MKQAIAIILFALAAQASAADTASGGPVTTLKRGDYACERPGDAASMRGVPAPEESFTVTNGSSYSADGKTGTYLRIGDMVTMTSGPRKGNRYNIRNDRFLRKLDAAGNPGELRCVWQG